MMKRRQEWTSLWLVVASIIAVAGLALAPQSRAVGTEIDLGELLWGLSLVQELYMENKGKDVLTITNVETSCECVSVLSYPRQVAPSGKGEIAVGVAAEREGSFRYQVDVLTADSAAPRRSFFLTVTVVPWTLADMSLAGKVTRPLPWPTRVVEVREQSLYVPVEEVLSPLSKASAWTFVDVRDIRGHEIAHIPGAINLALHTVKSTGFLRGRRLVLVDEGWGNPALEAECRRMAKLGFAARILLGGMNSWQAAGGALDLSSAAKPGLAELQARDFLASRRFDDWLVVDTRNGSETAESPIPEAVNIPFEGAREFGQSVARLVAGRSGFTRLLVVSADGKGNLKLRSALPPLPRCAQFFLAGGHQALREQLAMGLALAHSRTERVGGLAGPGGGKAIQKPSCCNPEL
jgi:rhodanese-related sulfurtransferase